MISITICSDSVHNLPDIAITLLDIIYVPKLHVNLMSVRCMTNTNIEVMLSKDYSSLSLEGSILAWGPKISNLFTYNAFSTTKTAEMANYTASVPEITLWHHRLVHTNYSTLEKMARSNTSIGLNTQMKFEPTLQCQHCPFRKQTHAPFRGTEHSATNISDVIVSDICGPFKHSIGGYKYFVTWIDMKCRYTNVDFLKDKECATVSDSFKRYMSMISRQKNANVKRVRTDNGGEYMGKEFQLICEHEGIIHETTPPYTPKHNGIAERYNRTLQEGALTIRHDANLSGRFWVSAIHTVNFVRNQIIHSHLDTSPYEAFWKSKPKIDWLRTYGSKCWALIPKVTRGKGTYKSADGIMVGYFDDSKAYNIWIPHMQTVLKARDVIFDEYHHIERVTIHATDDDDLPDLWNDNILFSQATT